MSDENPNLQPWIDPELEARVVAWVLGEASDFEAAELERAIAENPELALFKRRIEAVHGLLGASAKLDLDPMRMAEPRRRQLLERLGAAPEPKPQVTAMPASKKRGRDFSTWEIGLAVAACFILLFALLPSGSPFTSIIQGMQGSSDVAVSNAPVIVTKEYAMPAAPPPAQAMAALDALKAQAGKDAESLSQLSDFKARFRLGTQTATANIPVLGDQPVLGHTFTGPSHSVADVQRPSGSMQIQTTEGSEEKIPAMEGVGGGGMQQQAQQAQQAATSEAKAEPSDEVAASGMASAEQSADDASPNGAAPASAANGAQAAAGQGRVQLITAQESASAAVTANTYTGATTVSGGSFDSKGAVLAPPPSQAPANAPQDFASTHAPLPNAPGNSVNLPTMASADEVSASPQALTLDAPVAATAAAGGVGGVAVSGLAEDGAAPAGGAAASSKDVGIVAKLSPTEDSNSKPDIEAGSTALKERDYETAFAQYKAACDNLDPASPATRRLWTDALKGLDDAACALAEQRISEGRYDDAKDLCAAVLDPKYDPNCHRATMILAHLDDPDYYNKTITPQFRGNVEEVKSLFTEARGYSDSGQYDKAYKDYEKVLNLDPYNIAARKGEEEVNAQRDLGATEGHSETRSQLLWELDKGWNMPVHKFGLKTTNNSTPKPSDIKPAEPVVNNVEVLPVDELSAADQPYSTFSLHVSDVSFKLAQRALAAGMMPDADSIRPEEFYNAFDYGDPAPGAGQKIACLVEQAAHPFLQERNLVRIAMKVASSGRGAGQPLHLTVLLDTSGSMEREDRAASVQKAMEVLGSLLGPQDRITLIGFAREPRLLADNLPGDQAAKLVDIAKHTPPQGGTNMEEALKAAFDKAMSNFQAGAQNRVVMLTDGAANLGDADPEKLSQMVADFRQKGLSFDACGVGADGLNDNMLEALTRKGGGRYYLLNSPADADAGFARQLAGAFRPAAENIKMQVRFNPSRVGKYRLIGFEKHRLNQEDFRNDKVAAAQLAAEEAAVAVYQVQVLPQGEGEIGEVFVRFHDPVENRMVEQSWTIPDDAAAPALDKAAPSMQLAAASALVAEKLRGGPAASQIDLNALAPVIAQVRGHFSGQEPVRQFIAMFEQARRMTENH